LWNVTAAEDVDMADECARWWGRFTDETAAEEAIIVD